MLSKERGKIFQEKWDEMEYKFANMEMKQQIDQLTNIIDKLEKKLIDICNTCYEDKETAKIEKWIKELKGDEE